MSEDAPQPEKTRLLMWRIPKKVRIRCDGRDGWGIICEDETKHWYGACDDPETPELPDWWMDASSPKR